MAFIVEAVPIVLQWPTEGAEAQTRFAAQPEALETVRRAAAESGLAE